MSHNRYGMNWIRQEKRLAIYMRDNFSCVYCQACLEDEITLTLDHVRHYGSNEPSNLVTACMDCNVLKGRRPVDKFVHELTGGQSKKSERIVGRVQRSLSALITGLLPHAKLVILNRKKKSEEPF